MKTMRNIAVVTFATLAVASGAWKALGQNTPSIPAAYFSWLGGPHLNSSSPQPVSPAVPIVISGEAFYGNVSLTQEASAPGATWLAVGQANGIASNTGIDRKAGAYALAAPTAVGTQSIQPGNANAFLPGMGDLNGTLSYNDGTPDVTNAGTSWQNSMAGINNGFAVTFPGTPNAALFNTAIIHTSAFCAQIQMTVHASDGTFTDTTDPYAFLDANIGVGTDYTYVVQYRTNSPTATVTATFTDPNPATCTGQRGAIALRGEALQTQALSNLPISAGTPTPFPSPSIFPSPLPTPTPGTIAYNETPMAADKFVDSIGVVTHWCSAYNGAQGVGGHWYTNMATIQNALLTSGIRHIRDCIVPAGYAGDNSEPGIFTSPVPSSSPSTSLQGAGIKMDYLSAPSITHAQVLSMQSELNGMMDQIEGNNEPDAQGNADWIAQVLGYQSGIRSWTKTDQQLAGIAAIAPAVTCYPNPGCRIPPFGNLDDFGNSHGYQNSFWPEGPGYGGITAFGTYGSTYFNKNYPSYYSSPNPVQMTEVGYADLPTGTNTNQVQLDSYAALRYVPRIFFDHALPAVNIPRTYLYDFIDDQPSTNTGTYDHFGLLNYSLANKPSYNALTGLIGALSDKGGQSITTTPLQYTISGSDANVYHVLMQKQDGSYWLALWLGISAWDSHCGNTGHPVCTSGDIVNAAQTITLTTTNKAFTNAYLYSSDESGNYTTAPVSGWTSQSASISVTDKVELVQLTNATVAVTQQLCIAGATYQATFDDEFGQDSALSTTSTQYNAATAPGGASYSTAIANVGANSRTNNGGSDDAYYTDATQGFGGYNPFTLANGALSIQAEPVPAPYATAAALTPGRGDSYTRHWLSGVLTRPGTSYGYFEVAAEEPNLQGFWPAPLWLLGAGSYNGKSQPYPLANPVADLYGIQELDVNELFGNALGPSDVQQTIIYGYEPNPTPTPPTPALSQHTNLVVSPAPDTYYHTYGVLWMPGTPGSVTYYIDRVPQGTYPATYEGPMNPMLQLQVFASGAFGGTTSPPANGTPQQLNYTYYREYKNTGNTGCGAPASLATATPAPTPAPSPSVASSSITIAQTTGSAFNNAAAPAAVVPTLPTAPTANHMLLMIASIFNPLTPPTGWTALDAGPELAVEYCIVGAGAGQCPAATSYNFGGNGGIAKIFELAAVNTAYAPVISTDSQTYNGIVPRSVLIPQVGGLTFDAYAAYTASNSGGVTSITDALSPGQTESNNTAVVNQGTTSGALSLNINKVTSEAFQASAQTLNATGTVAQTTQYGGAQFYNGAIISIIAAGKSPAATPQPYPSPSYPAQPMAGASPSPSPSPSAAIAAPIVPSAGSIYLGTRYNPAGGTYSQSALSTFESYIGRTFALDNQYPNWGNIANGTASFPSTNEADDLAHGRIPVEAWQCGDTNYNVASGADDKLIDATAAKIKAYGGGAPIMLRWFWEMNLPAVSDNRQVGTGGAACFDSVHDGTNAPDFNLLQGPSAATEFSPHWYILAWQHIHDRMKADGATNVVWTWCPSGGAPNPMDIYYPGDAYVDWLCFDHYARTVGAVEDISTTLGLASGGPYNDLVALSPTKPIVVGETGALQSNQYEWFYGNNLTPNPLTAQDQLALSFPNLKGLLYFDVAANSDYSLPTPPPGTTGPTPPPQPSPFPTPIQVNPSQQAVCYTAGATGTCTFNNPATVGDELMLVALGNASTTAPTGITGWTQFANQTATNNGIVGWWKIAQAGDQSVTFSTAAAGHDTGAKLFEFQNANTTLGPSLVSGSGDVTFNTTNGNMLSPSSAYTAGSYVLGAFAPYLGSTAYTPAATVNSGFIKNSEAVSQLSTAAWSDFLWSHFNAPVTGSTRETATFAGMTATSPQTVAMVVVPAVATPTPAPTPYGGYLFKLFANAPYMGATPAPFSGSVATPRPLTWMVPAAVGPILALETPPQPLLTLWNQPNAYEIIISNGPTVVDKLPLASHALYTGCADDGNEGVATTVTFATPNTTGATTTFTVANAANIVPGMSIAFLDGTAKQEIINVASVSGTTVTTDANGFSKVHATGTAITIQGACYEGNGSGAWSFNELVNQTPNVLGSPAPTATDSSGNLTFQMNENGSAATVPVDAIIYDDEIVNAAYQTPPIEIGNAVLYAQKVCSEAHGLPNTNCILTPGNQLYQKAASSGAYPCTSSTVGWNGAVIAYDGTVGACRQFKYLLPKMSTNIIANGAADIIDTQSQGMLPTCDYDCTKLAASTYQQGQLIPSTTISLFGIGTGAGKATSCYTTVAIEKAYYDGVFAPGALNQGSWFNLQPFPANCPTSPTYYQDIDQFIQWTQNPQPIPNPYPTPNPVNTSVPTALSNAVNTNNLSSIGVNGYEKFAFNNIASGFAEQNNFISVLPSYNFTPIATSTLSPLATFSWTDGATGAYRAGTDAHELTWPANGTNTVTLPLPAQVVPLSANVYFEAKCAPVTITSTMSDASAAASAQTFTPPNDGNAYDGVDTVTYAANAIGASANVAIAAGTPYPTAPCSGVGSASLQAIAQLAAATPQPSPSPSTMPTGAVSITQSTTFNETIPLTTLTATGGDWTYFGFGNNVTAFDHKTTGNSTLSNISQIGGSFVYGQATPDGVTQPYISWASGDGTPDTVNSGLSSLTQIVNTGGVAGVGMSFTSTGTLTPMTTKTVFIVMGAYCANVKLSVSTNDGSFLTASNIAYQDSGGGYPNTMYAVQFSTISPSTVVTFTITNNAGPVCAGSTVSSIGIHAAYMQPGAQTIPTPPPASPSPTPGPLTAAPTTLSFQLTTSPSQTVAVSDPLYTGAFTVTAPADATVTGTFTGPNMTVTVTPKIVGTSQNLVISDGTRTTNVPVTVVATPSASTPTPSPSPIFTAAAPGRAYPYSYTLPQTIASMTFVAEVKCPPAAQPNGQALIGVPGALSIEAGTCDGGISNPTGSTGAHAFNVATSAQAGPTSSLSPGVTYTIATVQDAVANTLTYYVCQFPMGACNPTQVASTGLVFASGNTMYLGASDGSGTRLLAGDEWNDQVYAVAVNPQWVQSIANAGVADPYPPPTPAPPTVDQSSLMFNSPTSALQVVNISEPLYAPPGSFTLSMSVPNIVTLSLNQGAMTVYPKATGSTVINITGYNGDAVQVSVTVSSGTTSAYPFPRPNFPNAPALTTRLPSTIDPSKVRSYSSAAWQYYDGLINGGISGFTDTYHEDVYVTTGTSATTYTGTGLYIATLQDPVWNFSCTQGISCYAGWSKVLNNVHVPNGARTQNAGIGGCDCHLFIIEPLHWVPQSNGGTNFPDVAPYQYEIDIIDANNGSQGSGAPGSVGCYDHSNTVPSSATNCTVFNSGGGTNTGYFWGAEAFSTATVGWGGGSLGNINDGMAPGPDISNPSDGYGGAATSGQYAEHAFTVSAQEILNGSINHATGGYVYCLQNPKSGSLPAKPISDSICNGDTSHAVKGTNGDGGIGWAYGDLLTFDPTKVTDASLNADTNLNYVQRIWLKSFLHFGYYPGDTMKPYENQGFGPWLWGADPLWNTIANNQGLPRSSQQGDPQAVQVNTYMPERYYKYIEALDPCVTNKQPC